MLHSEISPHNKKIQQRRCVVFGAIRVRLLRVTRLQASELVAKWSVAGPSCLSFVRFLPPIGRCLPPARVLLSAVKRGEMLPRAGANSEYTCMHPRPKALLLSFGRLPQKIFGTANRVRQMERLCDSVRAPLACVRKDHVDPPCGPRSAFH